MLVSGTTIANCRRGIELINVVGSLDQTAITGGQYGVFLPPSVEVRCCNVWGNSEFNWSGRPDPTGVDGNISVFPAYCAPADVDYSVGTNSPHLPANNSCGLLIGSLGEGCSTVAVLPTSWGRIKASFR